MDATSLSHLPQWARDVALIGGALLIALGVHWFFYRIAAQAAGRTRTGIDNALVRRSRSAMRAVALSVALLAVVPGDLFGAGHPETFQTALQIVLTVTLGWLAIALTGALVDYADETYPMDVADNLRARQVHTQITVLRRLAVAVIAIVVICLILINVPGARDIGISLFASAGVAGLVIGMAARPALSNLIAGLQIALTGPISVGDVVIVEGEWGRIEDINATYVVVAIWDQRRLIVPLSHFIEKPFQNWTRRTAEILGTVFIHTDYSVPFEAVREKLQEIAAASPLWDGRVCLLQVTEAGERTIQLRALVSAADASKAWDLRCHVREALLAWLQADYPQALPRVRATLHNGPPDEAR